MARYTLPPINQIAGFNTMGTPTMNPASARQAFFQTPEGEPISAVNAGEAVYVTQQGYNPLFYGQTAAYTGPQGPTDRGEMVSALPELPKVVADDGPKEGISMADMMGLQNTMMYGSGGGYSRPMFGNDGVPNIFEIFEQAADGSYILPDKSTGAYGSEYFYNKAGTPLHKQLMDDGSMFGYDRALRIGGSRLNAIDEQF
tara:strand:+ start:365 stop:964 length:600 start_codon:yes stop_codon:yes gene_type:complete